MKHTQDVGLNRHGDTLRPCVLSFLHVLHLCAVGGVQVLQDTRRRPETRSPEARREGETSINSSYNDPSEHGTDDDKYKGFTVNESV